MLHSERHACRGGCPFLSASQLSTSALWQVRLGPQTRGMKSHRSVSASARRIARLKASREVCLATRRAHRLVVTFAGIGLLSGCMGDPPPDPETQPLEIIVGNPDLKHGSCLLNVDEVGAGTHEVTPLALAGKARVRILDPFGVVVFKLTIEENSTEGGGHEVQQDDVGTVRLEAGEYHVECILDGRTHSMSLRVVPARPGH